MENTESNNAEEASSEPVSSEPEGPSRTERQWAMGCHLIALCGFLVPPIASTVAPLVLWLLKREDGAFIDDQGRESLNFQITILLYIVISAMLVPLLGIGVLLLVSVVVFDFVCILVATVKASEGIAFRYPACIRLIK